MAYTSIFSTPGSSESAALSSQERSQIRTASDYLDKAQAEEVKEEGAPDSNIAAAIKILDGLAGDDPGS